MRVTVLGASGFIGSELSNYLSKTGMTVVCVSRQERSSDYVPEVEWVCGSSFDEHTLSRALVGCDVVVHLASATLPYNSTLDREMHLNMIGAVTIVNACAANGIKSIIYASSGGTVYGNHQGECSETDPCFPLDPYGVGKLCIENLIRVRCLEQGIIPKILRISNPYGAGYYNPDRKQGVIPIFANKIKRGETITLFNRGRTVRDFLYMSDLMRAFEWAIKEKFEGTVNIGSGSGLTVLEVFKKLEYLFETDARVIFDDERQVLVKSSVLNIDRANSLGWSPLISIDAGIQKVCESLL